MSAQSTDQSEMIQSLLKVHHVHVEILKSLGVDPCKEYEQGRFENELAKVLPAANKCSICEKECYNTQKMKNHMKKRKLGKTSYECKVCNKFLGDSGTLKDSPQKASGCWSLFLMHSGW